MDTSLSIARAEGRVAPPVHMDRFETTVNLLLSPLDGERDAWRQEVTRALRTFMDAERAVMMLWRGGTHSFYCDGLSVEVLREYFEHFAPLDHGMARRDALGLSVWSRSMLWDRRTLLRSTYFHEFALRHDLQDSVGLSLDVEGTPTHARVALLYGGAPLSEDGVATMLRRLNLILPVLRTGLGMHLRFERWIGAMPSILDRVGERLILYSVTGRELHRNLTMQRALEQDEDRERMLEAADAVARAVIAHARSDGRMPASPLGAPAASRQVIQTGLARYRMRGCLVGPGTLDVEAAVLVSMDRLNPEPPSPSALCERFGLTAREAQVACLLVQRLTNDEIADALRISSHTARHHTESVLMKVRVNSRRALRQALLVVA
jgi:DNA-binding CsgD family transcriptional regulator